MNMVTLEQLQGDELLGTRHIKLSCGLESFPKEILKFADTLEVLDLSGNQLTSLPPEFAQLQKLKILFCSNNPFRSLPAVLGQCRQLSMVGFKANQIEDVPAESLPPLLRWLILTDNQLSALPDELGRRPMLQKLMLAGNRLGQLPESLQQCERLELIRVSANRLTSLPAWLLALPRLAWLAYAGNPFCLESERRARATSSKPSIAWHRLTDQQFLGQGASGLIYRALWHADDGSVSPVAVKVFRAHVTSDGLPESELAAALKIGSHGHLTEVIGSVPDHPDGVPVLVMKLLGQQYQSLAGPPSFESCTRDVYADDARFLMKDLVRLMLGVVDATVHLHTNGVLNGDLYAHNLLQDGAGHVLMSDFGAASFFDLGDPVLARRLQALDIRAVGCLLEELLARCAIEEGQDVVAQELADWRDRCFSLQPHTRPSLTALRGALARLVASA